MLHYYPALGFCGTETFHYTISDGNGGTAAAMVTWEVTCDVTETPTLVTPTSGGSYSNGSPLSVSFMLPELMGPNTLVLTFIPDVGTPIVVNLVDAAPSVTNTFQLKINGLMSSTPEVTATTAETIPAGTYTVSLGYQDVLGNPASSVVATGVVITEVLPVIVPVVYSGQPSSSGRSTPWNMSTVSSVVKKNNYSFPRILKLGMKGDDVVILQKFLGIVPVPTKYFGGKTRAALIAYQKKQGLVGDGVLGLKSRTAIEAVLNK